MTKGQGVYVHLDQLLSAIKLDRAVLDLGFELLLLNRLLGQVVVQSSHL